MEIVDGSRMSARYTCDLEFTLIGTHERLCDHDGVWTGSPPECIPSWYNNDNQDLSKALDVVLL